MIEMFVRLVGGVLLVASMVFGPIGAFAQHGNYTPESYIDAFKDEAISYMEEHGCPASVILAIAMHESANGNSRVAHYLNNHFGIKGANNSTAIRSAYKGYESVADSYEDFIAFLKRRRASQGLFESHAPHEYEQWVRGIARSGYAASTSWSSKVLATIRRYELHQYDKPPATGDTVAYSESTDVSPSVVYVVKKGDTLGAIARKNATTVKTIQQRNNMHSTRLRIGQELIL